MSLHSALRAQLGVAVPAMALPRHSREDPQTVLLFFGIVDFLQVRFGSSSCPDMSYEFAHWCHSDATSISLECLVVNVNEGSRPDLLVCVLAALQSSQEKRACLQEHTA